MSRRVPERWQADALGHPIRQRTDRYDGRNAPVSSVTSSERFVRSEEYFDRQVFSTSLQNYKRVEKDQFAYNPSRLNVGSLAKLQKFDADFLSPMPFLP